ncbi:MAG: YaeQ family protein [bacterium]|nr:YaeQ family protein [bacterium]
MSAISTQHTFDLTISDPGHALFVESRLRLSYITNEPIERFFAKILAYGLNYSSDIEIVSDSSDQLEPLIFRKDLTGQYLSWIDIGCPSLKKLSKPARSHQDPLIKIYFYREGHLAEFLREFRDFKNDILNKIQAYQLDPKFLSTLGLSLKRSSKLSMTIIEDALYVELDGVSFDTIIPRVDLIGNADKKPLTE